jgi:spore photoproduct lyase
MFTQENLSTWVDGRSGDRLNWRDRNLAVHYKEYENLDGKLERLVSHVADGSIIKRFDKTPVPRKPNDVVCPHFLELKWATGCPYSCAWCYLQGTFRFLDYRTKPMVKPRPKVEEHLRAFFETATSHRELLNSGELADSLMDEHEPIPFSSFIMGLVETQRLHKVLFLTKSANVEKLVKVRNSKQCVVSFSINAEEVSRKWEKAPSVHERIEAAGILADSGFDVRVRIDPMVPLDGWEGYYYSLLDKLFSRITPARLTIGSLRGLQSTINNARDKSWTIYLEEKSNWGKKIDSDRRFTMYTHLIESLKDDFGYSRIALCKETVAMWERLGINYKQIECNCTW